MKTSQMSKRSKLNWCLCFLFCSRHTLHWYQEFKKGLRWNLGSFYTGKRIYNKIDFALKLASMSYLLTQCGWLIGSVDVYRTTLTLAVQFSDGGFLIHHQCPGRQQKPSTRRLRMESSYRFDCRSHNIYTLLFRISIISTVLNWINAKSYRSDPFKLL